MKDKLFLIGMLFFALLESAFAFPKVGDFVVYTGWFTADFVKKPIQITQRITDFYEETNQFLIQTERSYADKFEVEENLVQKGNLYDLGTVTYILNNCAQSGGILEEMTTPGGHFPTCRFEKLFERINIGRVPFGLVSIKKENLDLVVERFHFAL